MQNRRNYYRLLQVQPDAPLEVIRASYRALMRDLKQHPDLGGDHWQAATLNQAYETLSDPVKRARYDKRLLESYTKRLGSSQGSHKKPLITIFCPFCKRPFSRPPRPADNCPTCKSPLFSGSTTVPQSDVRRMIPRMRKRGQLKYYTDWPQKGQEAQMVDLSPRGMRFLCDENLRPDSAIKISSPLLKATAKVTSVRNRGYGDRGVYSVGVLFLTVTFASVTGSFVSAEV